MMRKFRFSFLTLTSLSTRLVAFGLLFSPLFAANLPPNLERALVRVEAGESGRAEVRVLTRHAHSDQSEPRLLARTALARLERKNGNPQRALEWVEEYSQPIADNFTWPRAAAFIEAARSSFDLGRAYDAVSRLNAANDQAEGLSKIAARRTLSEFSQAQPDLKKALDLEKDALRYGNRFFKRELISETAGREPPKPGHELWAEWKPEIEERITELERLIRIESYGLDYVLYEEAQRIRKADHPLALDFTNVAAAFGLRDQRIDVRIPGADFELAFEKYTMLMEDFPENPYAQAAQLYRAVCRMHLGDTDAAIRDLQEFYQQDPTGLYRGEALQLLGDIYLFNRWDQANAREAYERATRWFEAMKTRTNVLKTYITPEKSQRISQPPRTIKMLTNEGVIREVDVPDNALVNRTTADWYLDRLRTEVEWRLGFIGILNDDWDQAFEHFDVALEHDEVIKQAHQRDYFNPYHRLLNSKRVGAMVAGKEQLNGLRKEEKAVMQWADLQLMLADFESALNTYQGIQTFAKVQKRDNAYTRAVLGEVIAKQQLKKINVDRDVERMHNLVLEHPKAYTSPALLIQCADLSTGEPLPKNAYLEWVINSYPSSRYKISARYYLAIYAMDKDNKLYGFEEIARFKQDFPDQVNYISALERLYQHLKNKKL